MGEYGADILDHLNGDSEAATKILLEIPGVGRKTAEKMLRSWAHNPNRSASTATLACLTAWCALVYTSAKRAVRPWHEHCSFISSGTLSDAASDCQMMSV